MTLVHTAAVDHDLDNLHSNYQKVEAKRLINYLLFLFLLSDTTNIMKPTHQSAFRFEAKVLEGNRLEIQLPPEAKLDLTHDQVEVIVLFPYKSEQVQHPSIQEILAQIHKQNSGGRTVEQINKDLETERESWDS